MADRILIYENGQRYEIDSDLIYLPRFCRELLEKKIIEVLPDGLEYKFIEDENDTESKEVRKE